MTWVPHLTVATVVERDGRFLLVEEIIAGKRVYNQPAGHLEDGETILAAAIRETLEETGWTVEPVALVGVYQWRHPGNGETFVRFCFTARPLRHHPDRLLDAGIERAVWLSRAELAALAGQLRSPLVQRCIDDYLSGHRHPLNVVRHIASP